MSENQNGKPTVFITYNWEDASELLIKDLDNSIGKYVNLVYDKKDVHNWDSLSKFMKTIKEKDFVIQIISKKYLESVNCMFEVTQLMERPEWAKHVFFIVLRDASDIYDDHKKINFVNYWVKDCKKMEKELEKIPEEARSGLEDNLIKRKTISKKMGEFLNISADPLHPKAINATEAIKKVIFKVIGVDETNVEEQVERKTIHKSWEKEPDNRNQISSVNSKIDGYSSVSLQDKILQEIGKNGGLNASSLASRLSLSLRSMQRYLMQLIESGKIVFRGSRKNGGYYLR